MSHEKKQNRSRLKKYLGKKIEYSAIFEIKEESFILLDIKNGNQCVADHIWGNTNHKNINIPNKTRVTFYATSYRYVDSKNNRKYGLHKMHNFTPQKESEVTKDSLENGINRNLRTQGSKIKWPNNKKYK